MAVVAAFPIWALVAYFDTYKHALSVFYSAVLLAALILLLPGFRKRDWFWPALAIIGLLHTAGAIVFADFEHMGSGTFFLLFAIDLFVCVGFFMAIARLRTDSTDPVEEDSMKIAPSSKADEGAD
ncbi:MAG: hypothetical protein J7485_11005 [Sphingobium sp.]|nr:hypothetical protein [Sphingobium sp.]